MKYKIYKLNMKYKPLQQHCNVNPNSYFNFRNAGNLKLLSHHVNGRAGVKPIIIQQ